MTIVGVDLGGTKILTRLVDPLSGRARGRHKIPTPRSNPSAVLDAVVSAVEHLDGAADASAVGIGVPGPVTPDGYVGPCANLAGWDAPFRVADRMSAALGKPVLVNNDVNCAAVAEHRFGAARGVANMLAVFAGTGVGGGLILDNKLVAGQRGMAAEIGHLTVYPGGRECGCGELGHLEAYAGRAGIERQARWLAANGQPNLLAKFADGGGLKSKHLERAVDENDPVAVSLVGEAADALAIAIGNVATVLDLDRIVLGGGIIDKLGQPFLDQIEQSATFGGLGPQLCELVLASRLDDAGVLGAALLADGDG